MPECGASWSTKVIGSPFLMASGSGAPAHKQKARPKPLKIAIGKPPRAVLQPGLFEGCDVREVRPGRRPCGKIGIQSVSVLLPAYALQKIEAWGEVHYLQTGGAKSKG